MVKTRNLAKALRTSNSSSHAFRMAVKKQITNAAAGTVSGGQSKPQQSLSTIQVSGSRTITQGFPEGQYKNAFVKPSLSGNSHVPKGRDR